jgi:hypothetical protein
LDQRLLPHLFGRGGHKNKLYRLAARLKSDTLTAKGIETRASHRSATGK